MKFLSRRLIFLFVFLIPFVSIAQEGAPDNNKPPSSIRKQRRHARKKWKEINKADSIHAKAVEKHHKRLQTKKTLRNMKTTKKKSDSMRNNKREFFLLRWFKYRHH